MTLDSHCYKQTLPAIGSHPISWFDALHESLTCPLTLGLPSLSTNQFDGDRLY
jgi:hypothetical protein